MYATYGSKKSGNITFDVPYKIAVKSARDVEYAGTDALKAAILKRYSRPEKAKSAATPPKNATQAEDEKKPPVRVV